MSCEETHVSNDATPIKLTKTGRVTITKDAVYVVDFDGKNCSSRDVAIAACLWAIRELQLYVMRDIEVPGGSGRVAID